MRWGPLVFIVGLIAISACKARHNRSSLRADGSANASQGSLTPDPNAVIFIPSSGPGSRPNSDDDMHPPTETTPPMEDVIVGDFRRDDLALTDGDEYTLDSVLNACPIARNVDYIHDYMECTDYCSAAYVCTRNLTERTNNRMSTFLIDYWGWTRSPDQTDEQNNANPGKDDKYIGHCLLGVSEHKPNQKYEYTIVEAQTMDGVRNRTVCKFQSDKSPDQMREPSGGRYRDRTVTWLEVNLFWNCMGTKWYDFNVTETEPSQWRSTTESKNDICENYCNWPRVAADPKNQNMESFGDVRGPYVYHYSTIPGQTALPLRPSPIRNEELAWFVKDRSGVDVLASCNQLYGAGSDRCAGRYTPWEWSVSLSKPSNNSNSVLTLTPEDNIEVSCDAADCRCGTGCARMTATVKPQRLNGEAFRARTDASGAKSWRGCKNVVNGECEIKLEYKTDAAGKRTAIELLPGGTAQ